MLWKFGKWILLIDTIDFEILLHKMQKLNYSADLPQCTPSYLYNRKHFKQIIYINPLECLRDQSIDLYYLILESLIYQALSIIVNIYSQQMTLRSTSIAKLMKTSNKNEKQSMGEFHKKSCS